MTKILTNCGRYVLAKNRSGFEQTAPQPIEKQTRQKCKPIVHTINRTPKAFALAVAAAEYVLGWLPRGTHEFDKFVRPREMERALASGGMDVAHWQGVTYNPLADKWSLTQDVAVNYLCVATRPG